MITDEMIMRYKETKDDKLFEEIYQEYIYFRTYLLGYVIKEDVDRICSDCDLALLKSIEYFNINKNTKFSTYLGNAIINTKKAYYKSKSRFKDDVSLECRILEGVDEVILGDTISNLKDDYNYFEIKDFIQFHLSLLEEDERKLIEMLFFEEKSEKAIAKYFNYSQASISKFKDEILHKMKRNIILYNHK